MTFKEWLENNRPQNALTLPGDKVLDAALAAGALHSHGRNIRRLFMPGSLDYIYIPDDINAVNVVWERPEYTVDGNAEWRPTIAQRKGSDDAVIDLEIAILHALGVTPIIKFLPETLCQLPLPPWGNILSDDEDARLYTAIMFKSEALAHAQAYLQQLLAATIKIAKEE